MKEGLEWKAGMEGRSKGKLEWKKIKDGQRDGLDWKEGQNVCFA